MSKRKLIDTNLIVRHLVQDNEKQASVAGKLFDACDRGQVAIVVLPAVLAECVFVLESFYEHERTDITSALSRLISSPGVEIVDAAIHLDALDRYARIESPLRRLPDCCHSNRRGHAGCLVRSGLPKIRRRPGGTRVVPNQAKLERATVRPVSPVSIGRVRGPVSG